MNVFMLILKFLRLKALEVQNWTERKLVATKVSLILVFAFFFTPFLFAAVTTRFDPSDRTVSTVFGICLIPMIVFMVITVLRVGAIAGTLYALGAAVKAVKPGEKEAHDAKDDEHAKKAFTGLVFRKFIRAFTWMTYIYFFYLIVPVWRSFIWYMGSIALVTVVVGYVLGYPEDNKPEYRKRLLFAALAAFMGVVMVSTGAVRWTAESSEAAWQTLPSVMAFSTAFVLLLSGVVLMILAPLSPERVEKSLKIASKVSFVGSVAVFALVFLFGDMNWLTVRQGYSEIKAGPRAAAAIERWTDDNDDHEDREPEGDATPVTTPEGSDQTIVGQPVNEALPPPPPEPSQPSKPSQPERMAAKESEAVTTRQPTPAPVPEPARVVQTAHQGDEFDQVTDLLDSSANHRAAAGL